MDAAARKTKKQHKQLRAHPKDTDVPAFASEGLRRRRKDTSGREYDEVDDRITIPLATGRVSHSQQQQQLSHRIGVTVSTSSSSAIASSSAAKSHSSSSSSPSASDATALRTSEAILQSGLSKYRSLSGKATAPATTTSSTTTTTTTTLAASTTTSPTVIIPGASLNVPLASDCASDARGLQHPPTRARPQHRSHQHHQHHHHSASHRATAPGPADDLSPYDHAMRLKEQKQHAAAIPFFTQALARVSSSSGASGPSGHQSALRIYYHRGVCLLAAQKFDKAIEDFTRVITMTPKRAQLFAKRARAYAQLPHYHAALSDYSEAIELLSSSSSSSTTSAGFADAPSSRADLRSLFVARARVHVALNDSRRALDDLARAESTDGHRDADVYYTRAHVLMARGDDRLALQDLDRFLELQDDELAHHDIVVSDTCSPSTSRTEALERMQDVRFDRAKLVLSLAAAQENAYQTDADVVAIEQGSERASGATRRPGYQSPEAIALVLRAVADYSVLLDVASASLNVPEVLLKRSDALGRIGRFPDALSDLDRAQALAPHDFEVRLARATLFQHQGDLSAAIDEITAVLQLNGFFVDALFFRAALYEQTGAFAKAQRDYTSIIEAHYDLRGESYSDGARSGSPTGGAAATEQTPLLSKGAGSSSKSTAKSAGPSPAKPHKILSQYSKRALLLRARVHVALERFDDAIADYERIQQSFPNELEPQLELPDVVAKKDAWVERKRLEALESLLAREDEERRDAKRAGATGATGASKKKKKKKSKKSKQKSRPTPTESGYVLLPDDDDDDDDADELASDKVGSVENVEITADTVDNATASTPVATARDDAVSTEQQATSSADVPVAVDTTPPLATAGHKTRSARPSPTASVTRDEACESMWEQADDPVESVEDAHASTVAPSQAPAPVSRLSDVTSPPDPQSSPPATTPAPRASHRYPTDDDTDGGSVSDERVGESGDDSASDASRHTRTDASAPPSSSAANSVREVLVDRKYLLKRERQLKNVRMDLLAACDARDRVAIDEVLERAERKQMTESLEDEIRRAKDVLARLDSDESGEVGSGESGAVEGNDGGENGDVGGNAAPESSEADDLIAPESPQDERTPAVSPAAVSVQASRADPTESGSTEGAVAAPASASSPSVAATLHKHRAHRQASPTASPRDGDVSTAPTTASKPPSLVIRPIAYGQALQLAEQSQHQFAQTQRLLVEKDAEIAALRQLLAQSQRDAAIERFDTCDSGDLARRVSALRVQFPSKELRDVCSRIDTLVRWLGPTDDADLTRRKVLAFVHRVLEAANFALGAPILVFPTGSFPMKTYLPTADLDVCLLLPQELEPTWHFPVLHALCLAGSGASSTGGVIGSSGAVPGDTGGPNALNGSPNGKQAVAGSSAPVASGLNGYATNTVRNVNFINADVRVIKCTIDNISVDFTANRVGALGALLLLDAMAARVGKDHLLKKSLILIKAWCIHESSAYTAAPHGSPAQPQTTGASAHGPSGHSVLGASYGAFSTYAINTVVMGLFNQHGTKIAHPLHALFLFLDRMAEFPWHDAALTLHGPVPLSALASGASVVSTQAMLLKKKVQLQQSGGSRKSEAGDVYTAKLSLDDVEHIRQRTQDHFGGFSAAQASAANGFKAKSTFQLRAVNIVDPLDEKNNLARSVSAEWFPAMKRAFRLGRNRLALLLASPKTTPNGGVSRVDELDDFFATSWRTYGRGDGWRPDLLVHPRQVWHGKASSGSAAGGSSASGVGSNEGQSDDLRWQSILPELVPMSANPYQQAQPQGAMYYPPQYQYHHPHVHHVSSPAHSGGTGTAGNGGVPIGLGLSEPLPYQSHHPHQRRSFDSSSSSSKTSPLKSMPSLRHRSASGMSGAVYNSGNGSSGAKVVRPFDSPPSATSLGQQQQR